FGHKHHDSLVLRPFNSKEAMTGQAYRLPPKTLNKISREIKKLNLVDYVFYDLTHKPPGTIEWE
ncbi:MAG: hypothetical protein ACOZAJ_01855, partial [Patescibacteria group bacterium]